MNKQCFKCKQKMRTTGFIYLDSRNICFEKLHCDKCGKDIRLRMIDHDPKQQNKSRDGKVVGGPRERNQKGKSLGKEKQQIHVRK